MNLLKTTIFLLFFTSLSFSQTKTENDTILASQYFKKADSLLADRKLDSSIVYFKKALPIYKKAKAWERVAGCYNGISENFEYKSKLKRMLFNAEKALTISNSLQGQNSIEKAKALENIGFYNRLSGKDYKKAFDYYFRALKIKKEILPKQSPSIAKSLDDLGLVKRELYEYNEALKYYKESLKIRIELYKEEDWIVATSYRNIADILILQANYGEALKYLNKSKSITEKVLGFNNLETAYLYFDIGSYYFSTGSYNNSLKYFKKCLDIQNSGLEKNTQYIGFTYSRIARNYIAKFSYDEALKYFKKALVLEQNSPVKNDIWIGAYLNNIGNAYRGKNENDKALEYYNKSFNTYLKALGPDHYRISNSYYRIGLTYSDKKDYDKALDYLYKAINIRLKTSTDQARIANLYFDVGSTYRQKKEFKEALDWIDKSLEIRSMIYGNNHPNIAKSYNEIGNVLYEMGNYDEAIINCKKAFEANSYEEKYNTNRNKYDINSIFELNIFLSTLETQAKTYKQYYRKEKAINSLKNSMTIYKKADTIINNIRLAINNYQDKVTFAKQAKEVYQGAIESNILLNEYKNNQKILEEAFYYAEKSKSNTLKDILNSTNAKNFSGLSSDLVELEKDLRINKAFYKSKVNTERSNKQIDSIKLSNYESKLFDISRRQDSLTEVLEKNYPKYYELKYQNEVISVAEIQGELNEKTTLLEFFTSDSITYAFTISKNKIAVKELTIPQLAEQVEQFQNSITKNVEEHKTISYLLYQQLIAPVEDQFVGNQLIIVPDGPLWHLNFDLLHIQEDPSNNPKTWPYLLKEYAISYVNSATLLFGDKVQKDPGSQGLQECLAFSFSGGDNISSTRNVSLKAFRNSNIDLPGTREEIKAIANIVDGQYFYGSEATEQNFKKHAGDYNILHLAVHGAVDNERPENSKLYFTKSKDTIEDNFLYSHELFALDIPAELTVLSACNTGTGKIAKGEGIMSLGNAFQYAGTKSLLLTNWEVSDETTPKIMEYFYTHLKEGKNKAEALQQAKLQFLTTTNQETDHPYYWGGFYLLGDTTPIQFHDTNYIYWVIGFGVLALIALSLFWYRRKNSSLRRG